MRKQLTDVAKGTGKGLVSAISHVTLVGAPLAEDLYKSTKTKVERAAYITTEVATFVAGIAGVETLVYLTHSS